MCGDKAVAEIVVLPAIGGSRLRDDSITAWLSRATLSRANEPKELLATVLDALNRPYPEQGLAALRMWGQTGDRPTVWLAAADPVYLEPRLDHLCLHALDDDAMPTANGVTVRSKITIISTANQELVLVDDDFLAGVRTVGDFQLE